MISGYAEFSQFYDNLTVNVDYKKRADYLLALLERYGHKSGITLDLACGTGTLTLELKKRGIDVYGVDASCDMLMKAQEKAYEANESILFLCQKMQELDLYGTIDTCFCTLDSINHLPSCDDVQRAFDKVSLFMNNGGYFIFDVNTPYKHQNILSNKTYVYDTEQVYCVWQNSLEKDRLTVRINLDFFSKNENGTYTKSSEHFCEKAYPQNEIKEMLYKSGLELVDIFEELTFNPPNSKTQREVYIAKKR